MNSGYWPGIRSRDAVSELVDFVIHQAFYPVLMVERTGPERAVIEHVQDVTRSRINQFRRCKEIKEVIDQFERCHEKWPDTDIRAELKRLDLPMLCDLRRDFEQKVYELYLARRGAMP